MKNARIAILAALLIVAALYPFIVWDIYLVHIANMVGIGCILALSLNLLFGFTGQMSFAHAGFYGLGAYTSAILVTKYGFNFFVSIIPSILAAGFIALLVGHPTLKLRGHYLAIFTLALGIGLYQFFQKSKITGGAVGIFNIPRPTVFGLSLMDNRYYYYLIFLFVGVVYFILNNLMKSSTGRAFLSLRENETSAQMLGISASNYKLLSFVLSAMLAGLAGTLYAPINGFIGPENFALDMSITILAMVVIGGIGSNFGPIIGAVFMTILPEFLRSETFRLLLPNTDAITSRISDVEIIIYGMLIVLVMLFAPRGIVGTKVVWNRKKLLEGRQNAEN